MIYFIQCQDGNAYIKIGRATNIWARLQQIQSSCPYMIKLLATLPGGPMKEAELHERFQAQHVRGEWFTPSPELMDVIGSGTIPIRPEPLPVGRKLRGRQYEHREWLEQKYIGEDMNTHEIAAMLGCSHQIIWLWLKKHNIPCRSAYRRSKAA